MSDKQVFESSRSSHNLQRLVQPGRKRCDSLDSLVSTPDEGIKTDGKDRVTVLEEVCNLEEQYTSALGMLRELFIIPVNNMELSDPVLNTELKTAFSEIEKMIEVNGFFMRDLKTSIRMEGNVGEQFLNLSLSLPLYTKYLKHHGKAILALAALRRENAAVEAIAKLAESDSRLSGLLLTDLFALPEAQLRRYKNLIQSVYTLTPTDHVDKAPLSKVFTAVVRCVRAHIALAKRQEGEAKRREQLKKLMEVQETLSGFDLVSSTRLFVKQGNLKLHCQDSDDKDYMFWLFNDVVLYGEKAATEEKYTVERMMQVRDCRVSEVKEEGKDSLFSIKSSDNSLVVQAASPSERDDWLQAFKAHSK